MGCSIFSMGMEKVNRDPIPGSDLTLISPPSCLIIIFEMVRPRPMPLLLMSLVLEIYPKNLNNLSKSSDVMPKPVSSTIVTSC
jgi:hypothetical protein